MISNRLFLMFFSLNNIIFLTIWFSQQYDCWTCWMWYIFLFWIKVWFRGGKKETLLQWHPFYIHLSNISLITVMLPLYLQRTWVQLHFVHWIEMHCMKDIALTETSKKEHLNILHCTLIGKRDLFSFSRAACFQAFLTPHHRTRWLLSNIKGCCNLKIK